MPYIQFHRKISKRYPGWDYSNPGWYFVTIRIRHSCPSLCKINQGVVCLSRIGEIINEEWRKTQEIRRGKVAIDQYVIMPDHMHGILIIEDFDSVATPRWGIKPIETTIVATPRRGVATEGNNRQGCTPMDSVANAAPRREHTQMDIPPVGAPRRGAPTDAENGRSAVPGNTKMNWAPGSLGAIICQFKSKCTKRIRAEGFVDYSWQPRYFDRVIRNEKELSRIRSYILMNPYR